MLRYDGWLIVALLYTIHLVKGPPKGNLGMGIARAVSPSIVAGGGKIDKIFNEYLNYVTVFLLRIH